ncbi:uncharacterized protein [Parasteatoda tepidariorum]|nr:uncharacterized protein LOC107447821 isoform X2 [Parasteatoda tepidariorum]
MTHCRKRPRCEEDCCELMPISKRINDLHIRSGLTDPSAPINTIPEMHPRARNVREIFNGMYVPEMQREVGMTREVNVMGAYRPELSASENPYYYQVNGVLYEAHAMRMQRLSK